MLNIRTDLALEAKEIYQSTADKLDTLPGVETQEEEKEGVYITRVRVASKEGSDALGKPQGNYITIEIPGIHTADTEVYEMVCGVLADEMSKLVKIPEKGEVLVVGLGNHSITADSMGPKAVEKLMVTRHLIQHIPEYIDERVKPVSSIAPGVLGTTGIETGEIVKGVIEKIKPSLVIAIDALAARRIDRINTTIQITDTGINPGSGIGNKRQGLNKDTLGIPVIAIGVPTVVDASTMAKDTIDMVISHIKKKIGNNEHINKLIEQINTESKTNIIGEALEPYLGDLTVTTKQIDTVTEKMSKILANGVNMALHKGINLSDIENFMG